MSKALLVIDVQYDFINGSLAVDGGERVAYDIRAYLDSSASDEYDAIVATQDWHINPGTHFSYSPDFINSWPEHCVAGTRGAEVHDILDASLFDAVFQKGHYTAAYSGFEGLLPDGGATLETWLRREGIVSVDICGIATDFCVKATALDAIKMGFETAVLLPLCAAVGDGTEAIAEMTAAGVLATSEVPA